MLCLFNRISVHAREIHIRTAFFSKKRRVVAFHKKIKIKQNKSKKKLTDAEKFTYVNVEIIRLC